MADDIDGDNDRIMRVASRGDGVTADGRYVAYAAPGDRLELSGGLIHGPHHRDPSCQHFLQCGGCQLQHLDDESLSSFVSDRLFHALATQHIEAGQIMPVHLSPTGSRRRVAVRSAWAGKQFHMGFSTEKSHRIVNLQQCDVMAPPLYKLLKPLREFLRPRIDHKKQVQVKMALVDQGVDMLIENWIADGLEDNEALSSFAGTYELARLALDEGYGPTTFFEPEPVTITLGDVPVGYPSYGFLQATVDGEARLVEAVESILGDSKRVADLFSGLGTFGLSLDSTRKYYAAEADQAAVFSLKQAAARAQRSIFAEHRDLFRRPLMIEELNKLDAVVLDPPRAGAKEQAHQLAASDVSKIAYVSCNPNSFARDAKILTDGGYRLGRIWPVGQFRWSSHIEMVGEFLK